MKIELEPGKYVVAVSGGVDSIVLLHLLVTQQNRSPFTVHRSPAKNESVNGEWKTVNDARLVVAHFDHGIRENSEEDRKFVAALAEQYGLEFYYEAGKLGPKVSEALARGKRYDFLHRIKQQTGASAIITAHHEDDLIETAILNLRRGTGRRGLSSLQSTNEIKRPLLNIPKQVLIDYAQTNKLTWHEDSTNTDERYARNNVRRNIMPKLSEKTRQQFVRIITEARQGNGVLDALLEELLILYASSTELDRRWFMSLEHAVAREVLLAWLRQAQLTQLNRRRIEQLVVLAKTLSHGKLIDVNAAFQLKITTNTLALAPRER